MTGTASPFVVSRSPVTPFPASGWQRGRNNRGRSPHNLTTLYRKVCNFQLKLTATGLKVKFCVLSLADFPGLLSIMCNVIATFCDDQSQ